MTKHIPNLITCLNLSSGLISILLVMNGNVEFASWFILLAMLFDFFDGFAARLLNAYSEMGKELDSLADLVSFGVAPGLIIYSLLITGINTGTSNFFLNHTGITNVIIIAIPSFMAVCAALRLAKFNIDTEQSTSFKGLPTPANALVVISLIISTRYSSSEMLKHIVESPVIIVTISLFLSLLMVSRVNLLSLKFKSYGIRGNEPRYILIAISVIGLILAGLVVLPFIIPLYIIISSIASAVKQPLIS
jgi:CDP-diacylglycerol--serine O-phosphatidyltransferase